MRETIAISIDSQLAEDIDRLRGLVGRSAFCEDILKKAVEKLK